MSRLTMSICSCFNVIQPFGFIAIGYERLRIRLNLDWYLGICADLYQSITYSV
jgi:hypothetical protein